MPDSSITIEAWQHGLRDDHPMKIFPGGRTIPQALRTGHLNWLGHIIKSAESRQGLYDTFAAHCSRQTQTGRSYEQEFCGV